MPHATELAQVFNPATLRPGLYAARSDTPAYGLARALVQEHIVEQRDERYLTTTVKRLVFEVGSKKRGARKPNPDVTLTESSFGKAPEQYANWKITWWREAIQNATDAGATTIRCEAHEQGDGTYLVSCEDNGSGMDRDAIQYKLMAVGGSQKGSSSVGGFGVAKNLLLFHWPEWEIHSRDSAVRGSTVKGSDFIPVPMLQGTRITVRMPADKFTDRALAIAYIERCELPHVTFYVNGEKFEAHLKGKKLLRDEPDFKLWFNPSTEIKSSVIMVRVRSREYEGALHLFDMDTGVEVGGQIIVDLLAPSIKILTDNRDGFNSNAGYWIKQKIVEFAKELTIEGKRALKAKQTMISQAYRGEGKFKAETREAEASAAVGAMTGNPTEIAAALANFIKHHGGNPEAELAELVERAKRYGEDDASVNVGHPAGFSMPVATSEATRVMLSQVRGPTAVEAAIKQVVWRPDFYLHNEVAGFRVPKEFFPESMTPRVVKLLSVWTDLCRFVMMQLASSKTFGVGFIFSTDSGAAYLNKEREDWLLLNPFRDAAHQKQLLRPTNKDDLKYLYASAIHEATHMADGISYHDIEFAYALTRNMARCADGWKIVKRIEAATKLGTVAKVGAAGVPVRQTKGAREAEKHIALALRMRQAGLNTSNVQWALREDHGLTREQAIEAADHASDRLFDAKQKLVAWLEAQRDTGVVSNRELIEIVMDPDNRQDATSSYGTLPALLRGVFGDKTSVPRDNGFVGWPDESAARDLLHLMSLQYH